MSTGGPLPYLELGGVEIANAARTVEYIRNGLMQSASGRIELGEGELCGILYRTAGAASTFVSPASDPAPWWDPAEPGASSFLGLLMLGLTGYDSTITRSVTNRITGLGGGYLGGQHRTPRTWTFRAAMVSSDDVGAEYGLRWLTSALQAACDDCGDSYLRVWVACPPADGSDDTLGEWISYGAALTDGPHEVEQWSSRPSDTDNMIGCRDLVIVEWTILSTNPFLYKPPELCLEVDIDASAGCANLDAMAVTGEPITDEMRAINQQGDGLPDTDSSYGFYRDATNYLLYGSSYRGLVSGVPSLNWFAAGLSPSNVSTDPKFGTSAAKMVAPGSAPDEGFSIFTEGTYIGGSALGATNPLIGSIWLKGAVGGEELSLTLYIVNTDATTSDSGVQDITLTTEWQRFQTFALVTGGKAADYAYLRVATRTGETLAYTVYADGAQIEVGVSLAARWATPYIATSGLATTRARSYVTGDARILDETQGWAAFRVRLNWDRGEEAITDAQLLLWQDDANNWLKLYSGGTSWTLERRAAGVTGTAFVSAPTFVNGDIMVVIASWSATALKLSIDGAAFTTVADTNIPTLAATTYLMGDSLFGDVLWFGASSEETLSDADAAEIYALAATDPVLDDFSMPTGDPELKGATWPASTTEMEAAVPISICDFLFGPDRNRSYCPVTPPLRGTIAPVYTIESVDGIGPLVFESFDDPCPTGATGRVTDDPVARLEISGVPAGATVVVDCARQTITITQDGVTQDGQYLTVFEEGSALQWPQARYCDTVSCFTVATRSCTAGSASVTVETQTREG